MTSDAGSTVTAGEGDQPVDGAHVAIIMNRRVLVQFRPLPPGWELPGGHCDQGETPAVCAAREAEEETGLKVRILGLVGIYRWSGLRRTRDALYAAEVVGGVQRRTLEAWAIRYVDASCLPRALFPWCRQRIVDALAFTEGTDAVVRTQPVGLRQVLIFGITWLTSPIDGLSGWIRARRRSGR